MTQTIVASRKMVAESRAKVVSSDRCIRESRRLMSLSVRSPQASTGTRARGDSEPR